MNLNLIFGIIAFLVWSSFSTWYYVCQINEHCYDPENSIAQESTVSTMMSEASLSTENEADSSIAIIEQPVLPVIDITEDEIKFVINSAKFTNETYVNNFVNSIKPKIEGRDVEISIIGFTCDLGKTKYNQKLGLKRANTMLQFLNNNEITSSKIEVSSQGEISSINGTEEERQNNRKVSVTIKSTD